MENYTMSITLPWMFRVWSCLLVLLLPLVQGRMNIPIPTMDPFREKRSGSYWSETVPCPWSLAHKGDWGAMEVCPDNLPADGFSLKIESNQGYGKDDSGLNAVYFSCLMSDKVIHSKEGPWGETTVMQSCPFGTVITGVQMRSESHGSKDNAASSDINVECDHVYGGKSKNLEGDGLPFGKWCDWFKCPQGTYVCGLQTLVEANGGYSNDDTALNNIKFKCCTVSDIEFDFKDMSMWGNFTK